MSKFHFNRQFLAYYKYLLYLCSRKGSGGKGYWFERR